jgi:hypothetical protein
MTILSSAVLSLGAANKITPPPSNGTAVELEMKNVDFRVQRDITFQIRKLRGRMKSTQQDRPVTFDDASSFKLDVDSAEMAITADGLSRLLNNYAFAYEGAPLKNITVTIAGNRIKQKGTMHKGVDLPFELEGSLAPTPDGNIRLHADKIKSAHVPFKGLMHLFGEDLSKLVNVNEARGVRIEGDDIVLFPSRLTPPPHLEGRVTAVRLEGNKIVEVFGSSSAAAPLHPPLEAANYIYHRGGVLRFGKLTMTDSDLEIIDNDPSNPFDFFLADYNAQLVAGYSKNTPSHGLIVRMPDYGRLHAAASPSHASSREMLKSSVAPNRTNLKH